jgi:KDO2-lipid IV(A) lauroyltransferase
MLTKFGLWVLQGLAFLPLAWVRALGALLGYALYFVVRSRRHVTMTNLRLCFPDLTDSERRAVALESFVVFAQAWLDRSWLWRSSPECLQTRLQVVGRTDYLSDGVPTVFFVPHFVGLDAGSTGLTLKYGTSIVAIVTPQSNKVVDRWIQEGRQRFGKVTLLQREDGIKPIVNAMRQHEFLHLSPDMSHGLSESVFVPFYGQQAATVPSLSRLAKLGRARVVPLITRLTKTGYEIVLHSAWENYPTDDAVADTALMNARLETLINDMPAQYFWVHKRFKTRPPGAPGVY